MSYQSIDELQGLLSETVFSHTKSPKKAAGRALGTIIEIIGFYLIKTWGHEYETAIEKPLPEYANQDITHNVEFTLHHNRLIDKIETPPKASITSTWITTLAKMPGNFKRPNSTRHLIKQGILKNACTVAYSGSSFYNAYLSPDKKNILIYELNNAPYAMFECKRVGIEEGLNKGPQTIEKAKQGSYVARTVSSIQRVRLSDGRVAGTIERGGKLEFYDDYNALIEKAVFDHNTEMLANFILTVGIVSNHGNWFTSGNQNKEIKVLAQSYDWLLFLTDDGLSVFVQNILGNDSGFSTVRYALEQSYVEGKKLNIFTKSTMDIEANDVLTSYFINNIKKIESWFNVIAPKEQTIDRLKLMLTELNKPEV